jgi:hypothetical protein
VAVPFGNDRELPKNLVSEQGNVAHPFGRSDLEFHRNTLQKILVKGTVKGTFLGDLCALLEFSIGMIEVEDLPHFRIEFREGFFKKRMQLIDRRGWSKKRESRHDGRGKCKKGARLRTRKRFDQKKIQRKLFFFGISFRERFFDGFFNTIIEVFLHLFFAGFIVVTPESVPFSVLKRSFEG